MDLDSQLPHILQKRVIAHIEDDVFYIHNRRRYPHCDEFVACSSPEEIADCLKAMITQGGGVQQVVLTSMIYIARLMDRGRVDLSLESFENSMRPILEARKTNTTARRLYQRVAEDLSRHPQMLNRHDIVPFVTEKVSAIEDEFDRIYDHMSDLGADLISDGDGVFTTCFAEHTFILSLLKARNSGKDVTAWVPETRPYLQGAHLSAPSLVQSGIDTTLMSDAMAAHYIVEGKINRYMSAVDTLCMDGSAVNKVGTLNNAIICRHFSLPFHVFSVSPDRTKKTLEDIEMEERDPEELFVFENRRITAEGVKGVYPAFDKIPRSLITGIITPKGLYAPDQIMDIFDLEDD
ncbi:MAG: translation initiation factor 2 [Sphaerochaetaceae bacterium]